MAQKYSSVKITDIAGLAANLILDVIPKIEKIIPQPQYLPKKLISVKNWETKS